MHGLGKAVDHDLGRKSLRIEKQDFGPDLVDRDHAVFNIGHRFLSSARNPLSRAASSRKRLANL
jgi:hypothetical protein